MWIIAAVRVAGSLPVLRWAFAGALIAIAVDFSDLFLKNLIDLGGTGDYQQFDKYLDLAYMGTFAVVALRWPEPARAVLLALLAYRLVGMVIFEVTDARRVLLFFPNVFEFLFVFVAAQRHWWPDFRYSARAVAVVLPLLLIPKVFQEYALHEARWLDEYRATDVVADWWGWLTAG